MGNKLTAIAAIVSAMSGSAPIVPDTFVTQYSSYATGLSSTTSGQSFAAAIDSYRAGVWQNVSGVGVMTGVQPIDQTTGLVRPTVAAHPLPNSPLIDIDSVDGLWSLQELPNRATGSPTPSLNMLWNTNGAALFQNTGGNMTSTQNVADSQGGTSAFELQYPVAANAASKVFFSITIPPGVWTFQFDATASTANGAAASQTWMMGTNNTTGLTPITVTTTKQTFSVSVTLAAPTSRICAIYQGSYPSAAAAQGDIVVENVRLVPGSTAQAGVQDENMRVGYWQPTLSTAYTGTTWTGGLASVLCAKMPALTSIPAYTLVFMASVTRPTTTCALLQATNSSLTGTQYVGPKFTTDTVDAPNQVQDGLAFLNGSGSDWTIKVPPAGMNVHALRFSAAAIDYFVNGVFIQTVASTNPGAVANAAYLGLLGGLSTQTASKWNVVGQISGIALYNSALTNSQIAATTSAMQARLAAKGVSATTIHGVHFSEGDSITRGTGDAYGDGYSSRAHDLLTGVPMLYCNLGLYGATLNGDGGNSLYQPPSRFASDQAQMATFTAAGWKTLLTVAIGTNDSASMTSQSAVETYYQQLIQYIEAMQAVGCKVVVGTTTPCNQSSTVYAYDHLPTGAIANSIQPALNGNSYYGWRMYLRDLINGGGVADAIADWNATNAFASNATTTSNGTATNATYMNDVAHPNSAGHSLMASELAPLMQSIINSYF